MKKEGILRSHFYTQEVGSKSMKENNQVCLGQLKPFVTLPSLSLLVFSLLLWVLFSLVLQYVSNISFFSLLYVCMYVCMNYYDHLLQAGYTSPTQSAIITDLGLSVSEVWQLYMMIINDKSDDFVDIVKDDFIKITYFFALRFDFMRQKVDLTWIGIFTPSFTFI